MIIYGASAGGLFDEPRIAIKQQAGENPHRLAVNR
jgi:hypothetical protein